MHDYVPTCIIPEALGKTAQHIQTNMPTEITNEREHAKVTSMLYNKQPRAMITNPPLPFMEMSGFTERNRRLLVGQLGMGWHLHFAMGRELLLAVRGVARAWGK